MLLAGARDKLEDASGVVGIADDVKALRDRVARVATTRVTPPLNVDLIPISNPADPAQEVLLVVVPASADAPHMADEKYWGRSATGKRPLTDAEAQRLWAQRHHQRETFLDHLLAMPETFDPVRGQDTRFGHLYLYLRPAKPPTSTVTEVLAQQSSPAWIRKVETFPAKWWPSLASLEHRVPHPDGIALATYVVPNREEVGERFEEGLLYLLVDDHGAVQVVSVPGTRVWDMRDVPEPRDDFCISPNYAMELTHQVLQLAGITLADNAGYFGRWNVGVHMTGLKGLLSTHAMDASARAPHVQATT
ncbi:hypothetical protein AB0F91_43710 [Amycolatopsis sp. NPDC023774]|uniref:AlbA family DNA-binding domain-containing protein n=1 Tax=Amycolatopsis sp. NPDC023774 TaxID=3155015 RepID=UPI0033D12A2E